MKQKTIKQIKKDLDIVFAKFIKARDSDGEYFTCICCRETKPISQFNACHYHSRRYLSLRYDETNVNGGCIYCNKWLSGNIQEYTKALEKKHGKEIIELLLIRKNNICKMDRFKYEMLITQFTEKLKMTKN